jgi:hypothetical protein
VKRLFHARYIAGPVLKTKNGGTRNIADLGRYSGIFP